MVDFDCPYKVKFACLKELEEVHEFNYLGLTVRSCVCMEDETRERNIREESSFIPGAYNERKNGKHGKKKNLLIDGIIVPTITYVSETWVCYES